MLEPDYSLRITPEDTARIDAWLQQQVQSNQQLYFINQYEVPIMKKDGCYTIKMLSIYRDSQGVLGWSSDRGNDHRAVRFLEGITAKTINREIIDTILIQMITGSKPNPKLNPATRIGNYNSLVERLMADVRIH